MTKWRHGRIARLLPSIAVVVALLVSAGVGLLIEELLTDDGGSSGPSHIESSPNSPPSGSTPTPTTPKPFNPPASMTPEPESQSLYLLDPDTGEVTQFEAIGSFSPDGRFLAVWSLDEHGWDVLTFATGERVRVIDQPAARVSWSPDSSQLAISVSRSAVAEGRYPDLNEGLFIANADGSGYRKIAEIRDAFPYWSPRGDLIAVLGYEIDTDTTPGDGIASSIRKLILLKPDGSDLRTLLEAEMGGVVWAPSGSRLAFLKSQPGQPGMLVITLDVDTGSMRTIVEDPRIILDDLHWAPDESEIAFGTLRVGNRGEDDYDIDFEVHLVPSDGSAPPRHIAKGRFPTWSPDGRYLAFIGNWCVRPNGAQFDLMMFDRNSETMRSVTPPELDIWWAQFSPSEERIAFVTFSQDRALYIVRPDGSNLQQLMSRDDSPDHLGWTPDGTHITFITSGGHGICN